MVVMWVGALGETSYWVAAEAVVLVHTFVCDVWLLLKCSVRPGTTHRCCPPVILLSGY